MWMCAGLALQILEGARHSSRHPSHLALHVLESAGHASRHPGHLALQILKAARHLLVQLLIQAYMDCSAHSLASECIAVSRSRLK